jgi:hypothetical protein
MRSNQLSYLAKICALIAVSALASAKSDPLSATALAKAELFAGANISSLKLIHNKIFLSFNIFSILQK